MKRLSVLGLLAAGMSMSAWAADYSGYIIDQNCASKKEMQGNVACAQACIKRGAAAVLVTDDGKVYKLDDQDKVKELAGKKVTISGSMAADSIKVESVKEM